MNFFRYFLVIIPTAQEVIFQMTVKWTKLNHRPIWRAKVKISLYAK